MNAEILAKQLSWKKHREWSVKIPADRVWRPFLGLAIMLDGIHEIPKELVPNEQVRWVSLFDIPRKQYAVSGGLRREVYLLSVRRATRHYGMPCLSGTPERTYDFRVYPGKPQEDRPIPRDTLMPEDDPRLFRVASGLNFALSAATVCTSVTWKVYRKSYYENVLDSYEPPDTIVVPLGDSLVLDDLPHPQVWFPRAFLKFRSPVQNVFERSVRPFQGRRQQTLYCPPVLMASFLDEVFPQHRAQHGSMPKRWRHQPLAQRWGRMIAEVGTEFVPLLRDWFCTQQVPDPADRHAYWLPADLCAPAASRGQALAWSFERAQAYWDSAVAGYLLPPIKAARPGAFTGVFPGEIAYDLLPPGGENGPYTGPRLHANGSKLGRR